MTVTSHNHPLLYDYYLSKKWLRIKILNNIISDFLNKIFMGRAYTKFSLQKILEFQQLLGYTDIEAQEEKLSGIRSRLG